MRLIILHNEGPENSYWNYEPTDISLDDLFETENLVIFLKDIERDAAAKSEADKRVASLIEKNKDSDITIYILTDISCDAAEAPCGCYGFDSSCAYHDRGGYNYDEEPANSPFADCLCSRFHGIQCEYHKF